MEFHQYCFFMFSSSHGLLRRCLFPVLATFHLIFAKVVLSPHWSMVCWFCQTWWKVERVAKVVIVTSQLFNDSEPFGIIQKKSVCRISVWLDIPLLLVARLSLARSWIPTWSTTWSQWNNSWIRLYPLLMNLVLQFLQNGPFRGEHDLDCSQRLSRLQTWSL